MSIIHNMKKGIIVFCAGYAFVCAFMFLFQDQLLFHPRANDSRAVSTLVKDAWKLETEEAELTGWFLQRASSLPLVIYFGGNAQDVARRAFDFLDPAMPDANYLFVNYRGYGSSTGDPGEQAFFADALRVYDEALELPHNGNIVAFGRSLGSGVAVHLAAHRDLAAVVLVTPYDSITEVAAATYPWLPARWLLRHHFDSSALAPGIDVPALVYVAGRDRVIPPEHAEDLIRLWGGPVDVVRVPAAHHTNIQEFPSFYPSLNEFLSRLAH